MKFHLWEAYDSQKISVNVNEEFKDKIEENIKSNIRKIAKKIKIIPARLYDYFIYRSSPIPLNVLIKISKLFRIDILEMEKNIIMYKHMFVPNKNSITNPNLPLNIDPYFTSIISNIYFDGSLPKDGKGTYYNQKDKLIMKDFISKLKFVFGDVQYFLKKDHRGVLKCRVPRIIGEICKKIYEVNSFGGFDSRISNKIFSLSKENKIAFIITAILDEGSIAYDGTIMFGVMNKNLCQDIRMLCRQINLSTGELKNKKNSNFYYFHIKRIDKFYLLITQFSKKYPLISLRHKEERLKKALEIKRQKFSYTKEFFNKRMSIILNELNKKECSVNFLASKYLMPPRTIRRYMYKLMEKNQIMRKKIGQEYYYFNP